MAGYHIVLATLLFLFNKFLFQCFDLRWGWRQVHIIYEIHSRKWRWRYHVCSCSKCSWTKYRNRSTGLFARVRNQGVMWFNIYFRFFCSIYWKYLLFMLHAVIDSVSSVCDIYQVNRYTIKMKNADQSSAYSIRASHLESGQNCSHKFPLSSFY